MCCAPSTTLADSSPALDRLRHAIDHAAHLLPAQGPITVFIHHNTLHAFEDLEFCQAVREGGEVFGCQPYLSEERYRQEWERGRVRFEELRHVLQSDLGGRADADVAGLVKRIDLRLAMLQYPLLGGSPQEVAWFLSETDALRKVRPGVLPSVRGRLIIETRHWVLRDMRGGDEAGRRGQGRWHGPAWLGELFRIFPEPSIEAWEADTWEAFTLHALWRACRERAATVPLPPPLPEPVRHRDLIMRVAGVDTDVWVNEPLIRLCAAFVDQGIAHWPLPGRDRGLYRVFLDLYRRPGLVTPHWMRGLREEAERLDREQVSALEAVHRSLRDLGVPEEEWGVFLSETLLALRGWGGIIRQIEERGDRVPLPAPQGALIDLLAVRLLLERFALATAAAELVGFTGRLVELRDAARRRLTPRPAVTLEQRALAVFQLAQELGWPPALLWRMSDREWAELIHEVESFNDVERRRIFHLAYEERFYRRALDTLALRARCRDTTPAVPRLQVITCLDEREESFRRHLEEVAPEVETFGAAAFYGVAMYYRGVADAHFVPKCPIVVKPGHWVEEEPDACHDEAARLKRARQALGQALLGFHHGARSFALGAVLSALFGSLASIPLVARVIFPRLSARLQKLFYGLINRPPKTRLTLERSVPQPGPENGARGYTPDEMAAVAERQLRDIGLTRRFARLVVVLGHGSDSRNNPHKSAYDCGACGGSAGGPNGRALAAMLNDPRVRERLAGRGLAVPADTVFVGGGHNTCDDTVTLFDLDLVPASHRGDLEAARSALEETCRRNAHERCRRFFSAPLDLSFEAAHQHVEGRSEDLAQTRPELGHATNALCIVGRRSRTRGLFLDRRAFLTSYDPTDDDAKGTILARILAAAVPVCAGINLEYYFSHVDSTGWGAGTKLPHNVAALLGVMDGAASDLRTGLPWQMVEIHEPVRLLFVVETTPETMRRIMERNELIGKLIGNGWVRLATLAPDSPTLRLFHKGELREHVPQATSLPAVASSTDWYRGWRDHLDFALIGEGADA